MNLQQKIVICQTPDAPARDIARWFNLQGKEMKYYINLSDGGATKSYLGQIASVINYL